MNGSLFERVRLYRGVKATWPVPHGAERDVTEVWVALCEAVDAAHNHLFVPHRPGDYEPYRRVRAAFQALGLKVEVDE